MPKNGLRNQNTKMNMAIDKRYHGKTTRFNTVRNFKDRYIHNIKDVIGNMVISDVKPIHCQTVPNIMADKGYKSPSIDQCRITMSNMFIYAVENEIIPFSPVKRSVKCLKKIRNQSQISYTWWTKTFFGYRKRNKQILLSICSCLANRTQNRRTRGFEMGGHRLF